MKMFLMPVLFIVVGCTYESFNPNFIGDFGLAIAKMEFKIPFPLQADKFNYPVGPPDGKGYYNAQKFGENNHLGDDWNSIKGGNNDLGDPISAIANGYITVAQDYEGGWGNVIRITHFLPDGTTVESLYAHCDTILVSANSWVEIGDQIGTIGTNHDHYSAHLHLEIRTILNMPLGGGYSTQNKGYADPTLFIKEHR